MKNPEGFLIASIGSIKESELNPRKQFNQHKLDELVASIREKDVITPLIARHKDGYYELAAGHRRFRAAKLAGLIELPLRVMKLDDTQFLELMTIENVIREITSAELRLAAGGFVHRANADFCAAFGIDWKKGDYAQNKGRDYIKGATDAELIRFIVGAALAQAGLNEYCSKDVSYGTDWKDFKATAAHYNVNIPFIEKEVRADLKPKAAAPKLTKAEKQRVDKLAGKRDGKAAAAGDGDE